MESPGVAPARLGRYELLARLAAGGMGEIFLARLEGAAGFEKLFVVKRILPHLADDARFRAMLIAEARLASKMTHANICQVYELGETDGQLYIVMEYLEGVTLLPLLRKVSKEGGALELGFIAGVIQQATDALHYAHELRDRSGASLGIVHRDVTPTNLMLTDAGVIKILDFGIAKVKDASAHTQTGTVKGKYAYMAPEQLRGSGAIDRRADVFALGVVLYELLALRRLFQRKTDYLTFRAVMEQPIIDIRRYRPDCPVPLVAALGRALERDPTVRFDTARQFGGAVLDAISNVKRPWTQGEIGDLVRANFHDDIAQRSAQIADAVRTGAARQAMPLITQPDEEGTEVDDDASEFPAVSAEISETPVDVRHLRGPTSERAAVVEPSQPVAAPEARPGSGSTPQIVVLPHKRSVIWPLLAFAMVAVTCGALFLVWRVTISRPPSVVFEDNRSGGRVNTGSNMIVIEPDPVEAPPDPQTGGSASGSAGTGSGASGSGSEAAGSGVGPGSEPGSGVGSGSSTEGKTPTAGGRRDRTVRVPVRTRPGDPYFQVVLGKQNEMNRCVTEHGRPPPGTRMVIIVGPDGRPSSVKLSPESVDRALDACIRGLFKSAAFPRGKDHQVDVWLRRPG